jgi:methyl-accepting chemotaxis protein
MSSSDSVPSGTDTSDGTDGLRQDAVAALPENVAKTVEDAVGGDEDLRRCCIEYYTEVLPDGDHETLVGSAESRGIDTQSLVAALSSVEARLVSQEGGASAPLVRVVSEDIASIVKGDSGTDAGKGLEDATSEIGTLAEQQAENTDQLVSEVEEISASVEEVAATTRELNERGERARSLTSDGTEEAERIVNRLRSIDEKASSVRDQTDRLREMTEQVDKVVEVIHDIADQTNMLALNASIEAARIEEDGDGFAVVADEVKSLSEESKERAGEIEEIVESIKSEADDSADEIEDLKKETEEGLEAGSAALDTFNGIEEEVSGVSESLSEVERATETQSESIDMLSMMIEEAANKADRISEEVSEIRKRTESRADTG